MVLAAFLGWIAVYPFFAHREEIALPAVVPELPAVGFNRIGVAVELQGTDSAVLAQAAALARAHGALLVALHVVEGTAADLLGPEADDQETGQARAILFNRSRVAWVFRSPTMAVRPPYAATVTRSGTDSTV